MQVDSIFAPHQLTKHVKLLHKVVLKHDNKILVLKRSDQAKYRPGAWDLPGGNSEWPKQLKQNRANIHQPDITKEVEEETGIELAAEDFSFDKLIFLRTFFETDRQVYSIILGWLVNNLTDKQAKAIKLSPEHTAYAWIKQFELSDYDFGTPTGQFVVDIINQAFVKQK